MKWFQIKFLNKILYMKDSLLKFGIVANMKCTFCIDNDETIIHIFCLCIHSNVIWSRIEAWIFQNTREVIILTYENKLFGFCGTNNNALNCIMMIVRKRDIFWSRLEVA